MFRKLWIVNLTVLLLLLLVYPAFADSDKDTMQDIEDARKFADSKGRAAQHEINKLNLMKEAMAALIDKWADNKDAIENGVELTLWGVLGTTAAALSTYLSGGATYIATQVAGAATLKGAVDVGLAISADSGYVEAMETALNAVGKQLTEVERAIVYYSEVYDDDSGTYYGIYEQYLQELSDHTGHPVSWIDERVNEHDIDKDKFPHKQIEGQAWTPTHKHYGDERHKFVYGDLPYKHKCDGPCDDMFRSPHQALIAHREKCGGENSNNVEDEAFDKVKNMHQFGTSNPYNNAEFLAALRVATMEILRDRSVDEGCGRFYYDCPSVPDTEHQVLTCAKKYTYKDADGNEKSEDCGDSFRKCMGHIKDHHHFWPGSSKHSTNALDYGAETPPLSMPSNTPDDDDDDSDEQQNVAPSPGLSPANGSSNPTASPGDTHEARLITSEAYYYVRWYVASPSDSGLGTLVKTDEGWLSGTETEARLSYTFASDAVSGVWTITAVSERYSDLSQGSTRSYNVTVE